MIYKVVVNHEEQYSLWPAGDENPCGWRDTGKTGLRMHCLAYIKEVWTDMRPLSLRNRKKKISCESNGNQLDYPKNACVHHLFEDQALRTPEAVAIIFGEQQINYAELNRRANQVAHQLQSLGVRPEIKVGLSIERSIEMVVGLLGILKSGGVYVPLDPVYPQKRLQSVIQNAQIQVLLTQDHLIDRYMAYSGKRLLIDKDCPIISKQGNENTIDGLSTANLSHIIFTSGSTGTPKGVMVAHGSLCDNVQSLPEKLGITAEDVYLQTASIAFTSSLRQLLVPLSVGATVIIATAEQRTNPLALFDLVKQKNVSILDTVASFWENFTRTLTDMDAGQRNFLLDNKLRMILSSGGELPSRIPTRWRTQFEHGARLINMYGQTETIGNILVYPIPEQDDPHTEIVPLGLPLNNFEVYLMDDYLNPVAASVDAELCIGGPNLARGYINQPELTAEKFIPNPFSNAPGARLYRTGDLGRLLSDTAIEFVGRIDFQVNIRGFRIEPGEIEAVIKKHSGVSETVVIARDDPYGDKRLVAYVVAGSDEKITIEELRKLLNANLPDYMVPTVFVVLDSLPRLPNGKIDRCSLPEPEQKRPDLGQAYVPPRSELQRYLTNLWCNLLRLDKIGIHDRFFELGGTSILAARFVNRLQIELSEFIYIVSVFEAPTIAEYADFLKSHYAHAIANNFPQEFGAESEYNVSQLDATTEFKIDRLTILQMRECIPSIRRAKSAEDAQESRNPPALFILSPPRSGAALLRIMLAGQPSLFIANELQLLGFHTLREKKAAFTGNHEWWLEGAIQSIMVIMRCDIKEAQRILKNYERNGLTTKEFYKILQRRIGKRMLVDATSTYTLDFETLTKAEKDFEDARYIHFVSHPYSMIRSFQSSRIAQQLYLYEHPFSSRELGELLWNISHQNTLKFLSTIPGDRKYSMRLEDLMSRPKEISEELCRAFDLEFHPDMLKPLELTETNMMQASEASFVLKENGKSAENQDKDLKADERWHPIFAADPLSDITWELAERFGYPRIAAHQPNPSDGSPLQITSNLSTRKEFIDKQRQRRLAYRKRKYKE